MTVRRLVTSLLLLAACHDTPAKPPAQPLASQSAVAQSTLADPLALLPASSDVVIKVDVAALRNSPLWAKYHSHVLELIAPSFADCGYNPLADLATVTAGIPMGDELGIFVFRGLDRDKVLQCLRTSKRETSTTAAFDGEFVKLTNKSGNVNLIAFIDAKTMVMQGSTNPTRETLSAALKVGAPLRRNPGYLTLEREIAPDAAISFAGLPGSTFVKTTMEEKLGAPARAMYATIHVTDIVAARATVTMQNAEDAAAIVEASQDKLAAMKPYVQRYDGRADGDKLLFDLEITEAQIETFAGMAKAMMPAGE